MSLCRIVQGDAAIADAFDAWLNNYPHEEPRDEAEEFYAALDELLTDTGSTKAFKSATTHASPQLRCMLLKNQELLEFLDEILPLKIDSLKQVQKDYEKFQADTMDAGKPLQAVIKKITVLLPSFLLPLVSEEQKTDLNNWLTRGDGSMFLGIVTDFSKQLAALLENDDIQEEYYDALESILRGDPEPFITFLQTHTRIFEFLSAVFVTQYPALLEMNSAYLQHLDAVQQKVHKPRRTYSGFAEFKNTLFHANDTSCPLSAKPESISEEKYRPPQIMCPKF
jgi:hypothetical protein